MNLACGDCGYAYPTECICKKGKRPVQKLDTTQPLAYRGWPEVQVEVHLFSDGVLVSHCPATSEVKRHLSNGHGACADCYDLVPLQFRVTEPGWYRMRNGERFRVLCTDAPGNMPIIGLYEDGTAGHRYAAGSLWSSGSSAPCDLVERIK